MAEPETGWELVADCETAGVIDGKTDLPVRSHPWMPVGQVFAFNRDALGSGFAFADVWRVPAAAGAEQ